MTIGGVPPLINKPWFINPGLTLLKLLTGHVSCQDIGIRETLGGLVLAGFLTEIDGY